MKDLCHEQRKPESMSSVCVEGSVSLESVLIEVTDLETQYSLPGHPEITTGHV